MPSHAVKVGRGARALTQFITLVALAGSASSQTVPVIGDPGPDATLTIHVGDGVITGKGIEPYRTAWHGLARYENGDTVDGGIWVQQMKRIRLDGRDVLFRSAGALLYRRNSAQYLGAIAFSSVVDASTLAPISSEQHNPDGSGQRWIFNGNHVEQHEWTSDPKAKEVVHSFDLPMLAYDISATMLPNLIALQPLKLGYSGVIPVVGDPDHPVRGVPFKVVGREKVNEGRKLVEAWVVDCPDPTTGRLRFWFTGKQPYAVKMDVPANPGVPRTIYDLIG